MSSRTPPSATRRSNSRREPRALDGAAARRRRHGVFVEKGFDHGAGPPRPQTGCDRDELLRAAPKLGKEIAGRDRGAAIGDAAAARPVGITRIGSVSAAPQRRMHEGAGDQRQRPRPFETGRQHRVGEPQRQNLGAGLLRHDARGLRGRKGCGLDRGGELLHVGDRGAQRRRPF